MRVLIGCEESQEVCKAFRKLGHEAYSCDILPCSGGHPEWHIQDDVLKHLDDGWDLGIFHPPCTRLTNAGVCHLHKDPKRWIKLFLDADFFLELYNSPIPKKSLENPIMHKYARRLIGIQHSQVIQPWMFGHPEQKATCLYNINIPNLCETNNVKEKMMLLSDSERQRIHYLPPSKNRAKIRSKTFPGIARAMAEQWGGQDE